MSTFPASVNEQIGHEFAASQQYVAIAAYYDAETLPQLAAHFYRQAVEERNHAMILVQYLLDANEEVTIPGVEAPRTSFADVVAPVKLALEQEKTVTEQIAALVALAREEGQLVGEQFLHWFLQEQREEVSSMSDLLAIVERGKDNLLLVEEYLSRQSGEENPLEAGAPPPPAALSSSALDELAAEQLSALGRVGQRLSEAGIAYWLFGGWAVDFYAGAVTRSHDDLDAAVWLDDLPRIAAILEEDGWHHAPEYDEDGGTGYEQGPVRFELTYLVRGTDGGTYTPMSHGQARWSDEALADDVRELNGVSARLIALAPLMRGKSLPRDDPEEAAKDRADFRELSRLGG